MRSRTLALAALVVLSALGSLVLLPGSGAAAPAAASGAAPILGNVTGPGLVATSWNSTFFLNATGGPAVTNGTIKGTLNYSASLSGVNLTGYEVNPSTGTFSSLKSEPVRLTVTTGPLPETMTLTVEVTSTLGTVNTTANFTRSFAVVVPYIVRATLVAGPSAVVLPFNVTVALDGTVVGEVPVGKMQPNATFALAFRYPTRSLGSGYHTFTLSVSEPHGLVSFSNGATVESTTFYVAGATPSYTLWYVTGGVAFFGVLFIYATRVAARRRGPAKR